MRYLTVLLCSSLIFWSCQSKSNNKHSHTCSHDHNIEKVVPQKPNKQGYIVKIGQNAPLFKLPVANADSFDLSQHKGKVIMLQFTASWCGVCRKEMPFIEKEIYQIHNTNPDFILLGIDVNEPIEKVIEFSKITGITYPLAIDQGSQTFNKYADKNAGVTRNVIINRKGQIVYMTRLFNRKEFNNMKSVIEKELAQ